MDKTWDIYGDIMMDSTANETLVAKVMTFKSGKVAFSRKYQSDAVLGDLIRFGISFPALAALPIMPNWSAQLDTDLIRRSIFGTAAIEGNPLSENDVEESLAEPAGTGARARAEQEIVNLGKAYKLLVAPPVAKAHEPFLITEEFIRELNRTITADIAYENHSPGLYRNYKVEVGNADHGGTYVPPKVLADIQPLMTAFVDWINSEEVMSEGALVRAALAHYHLALIHPFGDGNGRTARLLEAVILNQDGYRFVPAVLSNFYYKHVDDYYVAFREAEKSAEYSITPFIAFYTKMLVLSVEDIQGRVHAHIRILALRDYYSYAQSSQIITQRQHDLLSLLLPNPTKTIVLKDLHLDPLLAPLYRKVSEKTARRDLERLEGRKFLLRDEKGYRLNPFALG